jgi:tetratricopeptide (TPR) repeat protein
MNDGGICMRCFKLVIFSAVLVMPLDIWADKQGAGQTSTPETSRESSFESFKSAYSAGDQALKARKFDDAVANYAAAGNLTTNGKRKSEAANAQGWVFIRANKWKNAKESFSRAVETDPNNKLALKNLGVTEFRLYEYGLAGVEELKESVKNLETSGENIEMLESARAALSREESYLLATPVPEAGLTEKNFRSLLSLGDKAQSQGQFHLAMKAFKQAETIAISPISKAAAANRQGKAMLDARRPNEAVICFEHAVKTQPVEKIYLNNLGYGYWILYDSGKGGKSELKKAVDAFYLVNSIDPSYQSDNLKTALNELKEVDPEAAKAYLVKEDLDDTIDEKGKTIDSFGKDEGDESEE